MRPPGDYKELIVWKSSIELTKSIYSITRKLPESERYGICSQMQRAAISIPSNIAEGYVRSTTKDFIHFLHIARGSAAELETQLLILASLYSETNCLPQLEQVTQIRKMLSSLISKLKSKTKSA